MGDQDIFGPGGTHLNKPVSCKGRRTSKALLMKRIRDSRVRYEGGMGMTLKKAPIK